MAVTTCLTFELVVLKRQISPGGRNAVSVANWLADTSLRGSLPRGPARQPNWVICHGWRPQQLIAPGQRNARLPALQCSLWSVGALPPLSVGALVLPQMIVCLQTWDHRKEASRSLVPKWALGICRGEGTTRQPWRPSLPLLLGGHVVRWLVGPSDRPPWESVSCPWGISPVFSALARPAHGDSLLIVCAAEVPASNRSRWFLKLGLRRPHLRENLINTRFRSGGVG